MIMLNRAALILRYMQPFVDWINAADPSPTSHPLTLVEANQEHTVYLVEVEDEDELAEWLDRHHEALFEEELNGWYTDPMLWPRDRSLKMLKQWCTFELHTVVAEPVRLRSQTMSSKNEMSRAGKHATERIPPSTPTGPQRKGRPRPTAGASVVRLLRESILT
jgi:hypothetical protein